MSGPSTHVVTGATGYTGKYITRLLLDRGDRVRTLTGHPDRPSPFGDRVSRHEFDFEQPERMLDALRGADTLFNTYWVRFNYGNRTYDRAVANTKCLFEAAREAGVRRIVHVSIANPSADSPFPYYRGKAEIEQFLGGLGIPHSIVRPAVIFGAEDILINNMAWCLRHFPFFGVPGDGTYRMQPVFVEDMARHCVDAAGREGNETFDACGPEIFTFDEWLHAIAKTVGVRARLVHLPKKLAYWTSKVVGWLVGDVILTWDEVGGLSSGLLESREPPRGTTRLTDWLAANATNAGGSYASEVARHFR